ncbi:MAG: prolyl oligopeptidase family serine peptidase [Candidatus Xenobia bacterium]
MKRLWMATLTLALVLTVASIAAPSGGDPYLWLEKVHGQKALDWVRARNQETAKALADTPGFAALESDLLKIYNSKERIPYVVKRGPYYYNFWQDANNPRGVWRRTTLEEYRKASPRWDVLLDVDALGKAEKESWVWHGADVLKAGGYRDCLIKLSRGGSDADVVREFDLQTRRFVPHGFVLPESKGDVSWIDKDHIFVSRDFGPGSMTTSGYPRMVKIWKRGTPVSEAPTVYQGQPTDVSVGGWYDDTKGFERQFVSRGIAFYKSETFLRQDGRLKKIEVPLDAEPSAYREWLLVRLRTPWTVGGKTWPGGALLATRFDAFMAGQRDFTMVYKPTPNTSLDSYAWTRHHLLLNVLEDVKSRLYVLTPGPHGWTRQPFRGAPLFSSVSASAVDADHSDACWMTVTDFLTPDTLYYGEVGGTPEKLKQTPTYFDASNLEVSQHFATSRDGTRIPYFQVSPRGMKLDGSHPTLLNGYGGFEVSEVPYYSGAMGRAWLSKGGVYVLANIRGGGEYGPRWHEAAIKANRPRAYEDFAAVAEDLVQRGVTTPARLGCLGGSNGGLLVGNMLVDYPQDFGAIVCQVPLLDMKRYTHIGAGASWIAEYGDPDKPADWAYIKTFSPYQNVQKDVKYPPILFVTSTEDDRVEPVHARKMAAKMLDFGDPVLFFENTEGGHGAAADSKQRAHMWALTFTFLWQKVNPGGGS